jgi:hypothetical protein
VRGTENTDPESSFHKCHIRYDHRGTGLNQGLHNDMLIQLLPYPSLAPTVPLSQLLSCLSFPDVFFPKSSLQRYLPGFAEEIFSAVLAKVFLFAAEITVLFRVLRIAFWAESRVFL